MSGPTAIPDLQPPKGQGTQDIPRALALAREWHFDQAREVLRVASGGCLDAAERSVIEAAQAAICWYQDAAKGDYSEDLERPLAAIHRLRAAGFAAPAAWLTSSAGYCMGRQGDLEAGLQWVEEALAEAKPMQDEPWAGRLWNNKAGLHFMAGDLDESLAAYAKAVEGCEPDFVAGRAIILNSCVYVSLRKALTMPPDDPQRRALAQSALAQADGVLSKVDATVHGEQLRAWALSNRGGLLHLLGHSQQARATLDEALALCDRSPRVKVVLLSHYGRLLTDLGEHDRARAMLDEAFTLAPPDAMDDSLDLVLEVRLRLELISGHQDAALLWSGRKLQRLEQQYRGRLSSFRKHADMLSRMEREREEERRQARLQIEQSRSSERDLLLRDMHDGFGSQLASAKVMIDEGSLAPLEVSELLQECLTDLSLIADTLGQDDLSLENALSDLRFRTAKRFRGGPISVHWQLEQAPMVQPLLPREILQVLRIVQEAVHNAWRHSGGRNIWVTLTAAAGAGVQLAVSDDGHGWSPQPQAGRGLGNMRSRAQALGAELQFLPREGGGAQVLIKLPPRKG